MTTELPAYKRILLKLSGEALMGDDQFGINRDTIVRMVDEVVSVTRLGVQVAVVIGGGNIFRGVAGTGGGALHSAQSFAVPGRGQSRHFCRRYRQSFFHD